MTSVYPAPAPGERSSIALSLVNTRISGPHGVIDFLDDVDGLTRWLRAVVSPSTVVEASAGDLPVAHALRSAVRSLFASTMDGGERQDRSAAAAVVNRIAAAHPGAPQLTFEHGSPETGWLGSGSPEASAQLAAVARDAVAVMVPGARLRECAAPDCDRMFIPDHGRRIWCSTACGGRVRALRHYRRRTAAR